MVFSILFAFKSNLEMIVRVINILQVLVLRKKIVIHEIQYFVKKKREREKDLSQFVSSMCVLIPLLETLTHFWNNESHSCDHSDYEEAL